MTREQKLKKDAKTLAKYEQKLRKTAKVYSQTAEADAINQRKSRAAAIGACALEVMDSIRGLAKTKPLMEGTLEYMMNEAVEYPVAGSREKTFIYTVMFQVYADEPRYTPEEIEKECEDLTFRLRMETDEMYPEGEAEDDGSGESSNLEGEES